MDRTKILIIVCFLFFFNLNKLSSEDLQNIEINADQFTHDEKSKKIYAVGNVEIIDEKFKMFAEKIFYDMDKKIISGKDNINIFLSDGTIMKTKNIVVDDKMENGKFDKSYIYFPEFINQEDKTKRYSRVAAASLERRGGSWEIFRKAVFSACDICYDSKKKKYMEPLIQFKANEIIHDKNEKVLKYYDTFLEISGRKVLYFPYFSHTSPTVKRKSGFLSPTYLKNKFLGTSFELPYYFPIDDFQDITLIPRFSTDKNPVGFLEHRKNFFNGEIKSEISGTVSNQNVNMIKKEKIRGHVKSQGKFDVNSNIRTSYKINRATDRNYLQAYKYKYDDILENNIKIEGFIRNNYYLMDAYSFQDLRPSIDVSETPRIAPRFLFNLNSDFSQGSLNNQTNIEILNLMRNKGTNLGKFFVSHDSSLPIILDDGSLIEIGAHLNLGFFKIQNYNDPKTGNFKEDYYRNHIYPQLSFNYSKPFFKVNKYSKQIFEPKFSLIGAANDGNDMQIPNEDSTNFDLDTSDLFNKNRLSGTDRIDNGTRVDYGINYLNQNIIKKTLTSISLGQSFRLRKEVYAPYNSGASKSFSNFVGNVSFQPTTTFNINSLLSIDSSNGALSYGVSNATIGDQNNNFNFTHLYAARTGGLETNEIEKRNQMSAGFLNRLSSNWSLRGSTNFNIKKEIKFLDWSTKLKYENECFGFSINWRRQYTYNSENPTSNEFQILISLKQIMENDL